jgi:hypothetical protein
MISTDQGGGKRRSLPQFALDLSTRVADFLDGLLYPFFASASLLGFVPDFIILTACNTSTILRTA